MSDLPTHTQRWATHRQPLRPDPAESVTAADREESRAAARFDSRDLIHINSEWVDADDVPALSDLDWD